MRLLLACFIFSLLFATTIFAAPYAAIVINTNTGEVLHEENADMRLHPAGLTKLMSLYAAFDAIETGLVSLDDKVKISKKVEVEPPVKLGLRSGQQIKLRYLLRAAAVQGANDASTAIAEAIDGSEAAFARRMNGYAKELGLTRSTWKNAHGLTEKGHLSTARDIANLFLAHYRDFPDYFNLFSRIMTNAGLKDVTNSSRRLLGNLRGTEGAKYGYTRAAGFNTVAIVRHGDRSVVVVVFGARSTATLNKQVANLANKGFWEIAMDK
jgi:D-alanyl-D-alanine carboxypeptidase